MPSAKPLYLCELTVYDPSIGSETVLRYSNLGYTTEPTDTPPNAYYAPRVKAPATLRRSLFRDGATFGRSQESYGELVLSNGDGLLDGLRAYGFDGRELVVRRGTEGDAYSALAVWLVATMESAQVTSERVIVRLRDRGAELAVPLQATKYAGDNSLPNGVEGVAADLKGKPKPRCFGVAKNVPCPCVNTSKLIYQVNDGPVASVDGVYDRGVLLGDRRIVAVGASNGGSPSGNAVIASDPTAWLTARKGLFGNQEGRTVLYALGLYIVGSANGIYTSPDFITWTQRETGANIIPNGLASDGTTVVAVGQSGKIYTSTNGTSWTSQTSGTAVNLIEVAYGVDDDLFVAVGDSGTLITSDDAGVTWTARTSNCTGAIRGVVYGAAAGVWVVVGNDAGFSAAEIASSTDGLTWTARTPATGSGTALLDVAFGHDLFVAVGGSVVATSPDGTTWAAANLAYDGLTGYGAPRAVRFDGDRFVVLATDIESGLDVAVVTSDGGATWTRRQTLRAADSGYYADMNTLGVRPYGAVTDYPDSDSLLVDASAPDPGTYATCRAEGLIRLGSPPAGLVTADVTEGAAAADRTAGQLIARLLTDPLNGVLVPFNDEDVAALDTANDDVCGYWTDAEVSHAAVLDMLAQSVGAWWGADRLGFVRFAQFTAPSGNADLTLTESQVVKLERVQANDGGRGLPPWRSIVRYARNYVTQDTDLAAGVTDERRAGLAKEWREAKAESLTVQLAHPLAPEIIEDSLLSTAADAAAEASRRQTLRGTERDVFECHVALDDDSAVVEPGDVVSLTHSRFGLSAGASFRLIGIEPATERGLQKLTLFK